MSAPDLAPDFYDAWVAMARRLGADPLDIARVAHAETAMLQRATDPRSNAGGIFPFMPSTLRGLGWTGTPEQFRELSPVEQLPWVERYLAPHAGYLKNDGLVYVVTFTPAYIQRAAASDDSFVIARAGSNIYDSNRILDRNGDGAITTGDLRVHLAAQNRGPRFATIEQELRARGSGGSPAIAGAARRNFVPLAIALGALGTWYLYGTAEGRRLRQGAERRIERLART